MLIDIAQESSESLAAYASISIAFRVTEVVDRTALRTDGSMLPPITRQVQHSYVKDYDAYPGNAPLDWPTRFNVAEWGFFAACRVLKVETQNINVAACRFYAHHSFALRAVNEHAYAEFPNEIQLLWYKLL